MLLGWIQYYGRFHRSELRGALRTLDHFIVRCERSHAPINLAMCLYERSDGAAMLTFRFPACYAHTTR